MIHELKATNQHSWNKKPFQNADLCFTRLQSVVVVCGDQNRNFDNIFKFLALEQIISCGLDHLVFFTLDLAKHTF